jgi:hypothetical protein
MDFPSLVKPLAAWTIAMCIMIAITACTLTGDLKYKTSDRPAAIPANQFIDGRDPIGYPEFVYYSGLAIGCDIIMSCYGQDS